MKSNLRRQVLTGIACATRTLALSLCVNVATGAQTLPADTNGRQQPRFGRVVGVVFDSLTMSPLANALVWISGVSHTAMSDKKGKFVLDRVPEGRHLVEFSSGALDSAGLSSLGASVEVKQGAEVQLKLASPSIRTLWKMMCKGADGGERDSGIVYGVVRDADNDTRLIGAPVAFSWMNYDVKKKQFDFAPSSATALSDNSGAFYACGLPPTVALSIRAYGNGAASGEIEHTLNANRISRIDFRVSKDLSSIDNRHGRASVRGTVVGTDGAPVSEAIVSVSSSDTTVRTDRSGTFLLQNIPAGTQSLQVRKIGMSTAGQTTIDLLPERTTSASIRMNRATLLGTVKVSDKASVSVYQDEFLERRRVGLGKAIEFESRNFSDLLSPLLAESRIKIKFDTTSGIKSRVVRMKSGLVECIPRLFLDGALVSDGTILDMRPEDIRVVEIFPTNEILPPRFMGSALGGALGGRKPSQPCGAVAWWTKKAW